MAQELILEITTSERTVLKEQVRQVTIPTETGEITILPQHVPLVSNLTAGELRALKSDGEEILMAVSGGFLKIGGEGKVIILADTAERAEELDLQVIEEAKKRALAAMAEKHDDAERFADTAAHLARELARWKVATKHRGRALSRREVGIPTRQASSGKLET